MPTPTRGPKHKLISGAQRKLGGWKPDLADHRDKPFMAAGPSAALPPKTNNIGLCSPVENQAELGSCTANASTSALEYLLKKEGRPVSDFSRLFVYYYTRKIEGVPPTEDSGAYLRDVMKCLAYFGAPPENLWPYDIDKFGTGPSYVAIKEAVKHQILRYYRCPNLDAIKRTLAAGYTCVGGFQVPDNMMSAECEKTGIVKYPTPTEGFQGGHAVHFVDYDDARGGLVFQNSWSTSWGSKGFGLLPYRFVTDQLADDFWTIRQSE